MAGMSRVSSQAARVLLACRDEVYAEMRDAGAVREDPVKSVEQILRIERAKARLLD